MYVYLHVYIYVYDHVDVHLSIYLYLSLSLSLSPSLCKHIQYTTDPDSGCQEAGARSQAPHALDALKPVDFQHSRHARLPVLPVQANQNETLPRIEGDNYSLASEPERGHIVAKLTRNFMQDIFPCPFLAVYPEVMQSAL